VDCPACDGQREVRFNLCTTCHNTGKIRCCARVQPEHSMHDAPCSRSAKVEDGGKFYCRQHSPAAARARRKKQKDAWKARSARSDWKRRRDELREQVYDLLAKEGHTFNHDAVSNLKRVIQQHERKRPREAS
jgi:hypothetical protein